MQTPEGVVFVDGRCEVGKTLPVVDVKRMVKRACSWRVCPLLSNLWYPSTDHPASLFRCICVWVRCFKVKGSVGYVQKETSPYAVRFLCASWHTTP